MEYMVELRSYKEYLESLNNEQLMTEFSRVIFEDATRGDHWTRCQECEEVIKDRGIEI